MNLAFPSIYVYCKQSKTGREKACHWLMLKFGDDYKVMYTVIAMCYFYRIYWSTLTGTNMATVACTVPMPPWFTFLITSTRSRNDMITTRKSRYACCIPLRHLCTHRVCWRLHNSVWGKLHVSHHNQQEIQSCLSGLGGRMVRLDERDWSTICIGFYGNPTPRPSQHRH